MARRRFGLRAAASPSTGTSRSIDSSIAVNLSPSRFAHLFRRETGIPPARYLHDLRMARARLSSNGTLLSVNEVMAFAGVNYS
jgi:AraC-like DNA-binding protein